MFRIIKVEELDIMGYAGETKYFKSLHKAKKYFRQLVNINRKSLADKEDCDGSSPIWTNKKPLFENKKKLRHKETRMSCWDSSTTENGTEYDITCVSICLDEIEVED